VILALGSHSEDVRTLQTVLKSLGFYADELDGEFGPKTELAVRQFQVARGLVSDGIVGSKTWTEVLKPLSEVLMRIASADHLGPVRPFPRERCFPLRCLQDGRKPVVTSGHKVRNPDRPKHYGVDLFYAYKAGDQPMKIGDGGRTARWWIPQNTWSIAPFAGRIVIAGDSATGKRVWLAHPSGWNAGFFHLDMLAGNVVGDELELGHDIGRVFHNPSPDPDAIHLHFELYWGDIVDDVKHGRYPHGTVDPELMLATTPYLAAA